MILVLLGAWKSSMVMFIFGDPRWFQLERGQGPGAGRHTPTWPGTNGGISRQQLTVNFDLASWSCLGVLAATAGSVPCLV